jgi:hypothetical protein
LPHQVGWSLSSSWLPIGNITHKADFSNQTFPIGNKAVPGAVAIQDFDFARQRPFEVYGFSGLVGVRAFEQIATLPEMEAIALAGVSQRKTRLLSAWDRSSGVLPIQTG